MQTGLLNPPNRDLITSLAFNARGTLLACSSLDSHVYIHTKQGSEWSLTWTVSLEASALVARFGTAGEFEGLLAVGCVDGSVRIFSQESMLNKWVQRTTLADARGSVRDVVFAPSGSGSSSNSSGLKLASIAADDVLRVYECPQPTTEPATSSGTLSLSTATGSGISDPASIASSGLAHWTMQHTIELNAIPFKPCSANSTANLSGFSLNAASNVANNNNSSSGFSLSSKAGLNGGAGNSSTSSNATKHKSIESNGAWSLSWCKELWYGECLAVAAGETGLVRIFEFTPSTWFQPLVLAPSPLPSNAAAVSEAPPCPSVDWAPAVGRSFQLIAGGFRDGHVRIWKVFPPTRKSTTTTQSSANVGEHSDESSWRYQLVSDLDAHVGGGGVGRVEFNITGTVLSTAGDDGKVRLYKPTFAQEWREHAVISAEESSGQQEES